MPSCDATDPGSGLFLKLALEQCLGFHRLGAVLGTYREPRCVHRDTSILAPGIEDIEIEAEVWVALFVKKPFLDGGCFHPFEGLHSGVLWMRTSSHALYNEER